MASRAARAVSSSAIMHRAKAPWLSNVHSKLRLLKPENTSATVACSVKALVSGSRHADRLSLSGLAQAAELVVLLLNNWIWARLKHLFRPKVNCIIYYSSAVATKILLYIIYIHTVRPKCCISKRVTLGWIIMLCQCKLKLAVIFCHFNTGGLWMGKIVNGSIHCYNTINVLPLSNFIYSLKMI